MSVIHKKKKKKMKHGGGSEFELGHGYYELYRQIYVKLIGSSGNVFIVR